RLWHRIPFGDLAQLRQYLREHLRFVHRAEWVVDRATRKRHSNDQFVIRRAVRYELLAALRSPRNISPASPDLASRPITQRGGNTQPYVSTHSVALPARN